MKRVHRCANNRSFRISMNDETRTENCEFIEEYNLTNSRQIEMLKSIKVEDFSKAEPDDKDGSETVYFFGKDYELDHEERGPETITCYIKLVFKERKNDELMLLISFHKAKWPIDYQFKNK
ncbi:hypothetical protein [Paraclostridium dentum]|uniref:hypothetical protein n=1 Tax=Paraclostridium dentum TaxID=2662455 RepID=UPI003AFFDFDE